MVALNITHRTLPAYRHGFLVNEKTWITTRTPLYYLDLAVPNEELYGLYFNEVFPDNKADTGELSTCNVIRKQSFHLDDISVGSEGGRYSNLFYRYAMGTYRKVDRTGMGLFLIYLSLLDDKALTSGERAVRFLNLATLIGYKKWRDRLIPPGPGRPFYHLVVERVFLQIYPSILKGIYAKRSEHPLLVKKFWDEFCITKPIRLNLFVSVPDAEHLKFLLEVANGVKFDFWGIKYSGEGLAEFVIIEYIKEKRFDLISLMVDYGFALMGPEDGNSPTCCSCHHHLICSFLDYAEKEFIHNVLMLRFLVRCYEKCKHQIELPVFTELYQRLSRTLPQPSLPPSTVQKHLQKALGDHSSRGVVEEMTAIYKASAVHPSDNSGMTPQTLSHLSRCVIRDRLAANFQLPTAIQDFYLPTLVKRFLRLDF